MIIKSKIVRDTILLTAMQLFLDTASLLLNAFITRRLGTSAIGILALTGSFLGLAGVISNGNAFLCTSRLISEEYGRKNPNPERVLFHGIKLCMILSLTVSAGIVLFAGTFSERFFGGADMKGMIRLMPAALISGAIVSCLKGYFNASRRSAISAVGDVLEFLIRCGVIVGMAAAMESPDEGDICGIMIGSIISGNIFSLMFLSVLYIRYRSVSRNKGNLSFRDYVKFALPIMGGGIITAVLSSTNDALIPMCLRQYGDSLGGALSLFGIFEGIVIPTLFFPSVILCSMAGIIVSETARASAAGNTERIRHLAGRITEWTLIYAIFASALLIRFGGAIGVMLGGGGLAGRMISSIAPVVPFIYMEIVLEAMIKGMGLQGFSSLNYLAEYAVRIAIVLIAVPRFGFWGIAASYYASNVIGNCSRFVKLVKASGMSFSPARMIVLPAAYAYMTMNLAELTVKLAAGNCESMGKLAAMAVLWGIGYAGVFTAAGKIRLNWRKNRSPLLKITNNRCGK
jgi:stage V sporulation protein B